MTTLTTTCLTCEQTTDYDQCANCNPDAYADNESLYSKFFLAKVLQDAYDATLKDLKAIDAHWDGHYGDLSCTDYEFNRGQTTSIFNLAKELGIELNTKGE